MSIGRPYAVRGLEGFGLLNGTVGTTPAERKRIGSAVVCYMDVTDSAMETQKRKNASVSQHARDSEG